jgi:hypothetical protein
MSKTTIEGLTLEKTWDAGTVVCEPQIDRTPFVVIKPGETLGTVLVAPLDPRKRRKKELWYYAFVEDLERWSTEEES